MDSVSPPTFARLTVHRGPRATERALFARLEELCAAAEGRPELLASPVWVVVASGAQKAHFAAEWLRRRGRAAAGVRFETLFTVARQILERAGEPSTGGALAFEILARRAASTQPRLAAGLAALADGYGAVVGSVRDLLDAGFTEAHLPALVERLEALPSRGLGGGSQLGRALELGEVAARCRRELEALGLLTPGEAYSRAAERLLGDSELLPARAVLIAGFANATGVALDFLEALVARKGAQALLDLPADPADETASVGLRFVSRLALRLGGLTEAGLERAVAETGREFEPASWTLVAAPGASAEVRSAVLAARALLDRGVVPERIAIVARDLAPFRLALRADLAALGVPFSGRGPGGSPGAVERRLAAFLELLHQGPRLPAERWLAAALLLPGEGDRLDLRLGLASLGVARLVQVAKLDPAEVLVAGDLPLPLPASEDPAEGEEAEPPPRRRRRLAGSHLRAAVRAAAELLRHLGSRPTRAPLAEHLRWLARLTGELLAWPATDEAATRLGAVTTRLRQELPVRLTLTPEELALALEGALDEAAELPLGGAGGGVAVLTATEARSLSFEHLFLLGANRDLFPRKVVEDPLLPDPLRRALLDLLPDLPVKGEGHDEERHLFAQLLAAAPRVELSYSTASDDGEPRSLSPLVERLRLAGRASSGQTRGQAREQRLEPRRAPHAQDPRAALPSGPLPAGEEALRRALLAGREGFSSALAAALQSAGQPAALAPLKRRLLDEHDPDLRTAEGRIAARRLGPGFGLVGPLATAAGDLYVTELEGLASCSWRRTLERTLGLEPTPDPLSTFAALDGAMVGEVVHAVVARWVAEGGGALETSLAEALEPSPQALGWPQIVWPQIAWPEPGRLASLAEAAARRVARERGAPLIAQALAARAKVLLEVVWRELAPEAGQLELPGVVGAELSGEMRLEAAPGGRVLFRADLVEAVEGGLRLTDLKAGRPFSELKKPETRRAKLLQAVAQGERLQAAAYALHNLAGRPGEGHRGRYLFAGKPEAEPPARIFELWGDPETRQVFLQAVEPLLAARSGGALMPRLLDARLEREGPACRTCRVFLACPQKDSGAGRRLARWVESRRQGAAPASGIAELALAVFELGRAESGEGSER